MNKNEICLAALQAAEHAALAKPGVGICALCEDYIECVLHLESDGPMLAITDAMALWPGNSGNYQFPVPSAIGDDHRQAYYSAHKNNSMWEGAYGDLRKELLAFLINHFEARVGMNQ